jgi:hypothetical protein
MTTDNLPESGDQKPKSKQSGSNKRQRNCQFVVRCTRDEFNEIAANARSAGLKGAAWLRARGMERGDPGPRSQKTPPLHVELLNQVKGAIGYVGNNVNQIARGINMDEFYDLPELRLVLRQVLRITDTILVALGKEPSPELHDWDQFVDAVKKGLSANAGSKMISLPADLAHRLITNTHALAAVHPSERPATGLVQDAPRPKTPGSKFLSPDEGHA